MRIRHAVIALAAVAALGSSAFAADPQYKKIKDIVIGGSGGWDYLKVDSEAQRLYVSHGTKVEVIDLLHFLISIAQVLEITPEDFYEAYAKKNKVNLARQDSGYHTKDEHDSRHI